MHLSYAEAMDAVNQGDTNALPVFSVSVVRNVMVEPIEPFVQYYALQMGLNAQLSFGEYDNVYQEAVGGSQTLFNKDTDCVLLHLNLEGVSWELARKFANLSADKVREETSRVLEFVSAVIGGIRRQTAAMILWHGFEMPVYPAYGIYDSQGGGQLECIAGINREIRSLLADVANAFFVDMDLCLARVGANAFYDERYWHMAKAPYTKAALGEIAFEQAKYLRPLVGKNRKCLVLDCDNTLWGGILGEDGMAGIKLDTTHPGSSFYEFQQEIVSLYSRGVIIALCSKNNEEDVWEVFREHPSMVLREEHIAAAQINWNDKARNLRQLALDLNIGLDSMVFMDDSDFEVNLVRKELPEVEVIHLPKPKAAQFRTMLAACGLFDTLTVTDEDRKKGAMYKGEASRRKLKAEATDMGDYYESLEMEVTIEFANEFSTPRIAQQTQKTNQFNLTTRRYNDADIKGFIESEQHDVLFLKLQDRFGDSGIVGTCIIKYVDTRAVIDTLLVSCRVLGRGVENAFMHSIVTRALARGAESVVGEFYATKKNAQVEEFYSKQGFAEQHDAQGDADRVFLFSRGDAVPSVPGYFKRLDSEVV